MEPVSAATLTGFIEALAGPRPAPGSGAAAAVTLALAAACAGKAVAVTLKQGPNPALEHLAQQAEALASAALAGADEEGQRFRDLLRELREGNPEPAAEDVLQVSDGLMLCAAGVETLCIELEDLVAASVVGDLAAARILIEAARRILAANARETAQLAGG